MLTRLFVLVLSDVPTVDEQHLISLIETRHAYVRRHPGSHAAHDNRHSLVQSALDIEPKPGTPTVHIISGCLTYVTTFTYLYMLKNC